MSASRRNKHSGSEQTDRGQAYFVFSFPLSGAAWRQYKVQEVLPDTIPGDPHQLSFEIRELAKRIDESSIAFGPGHTAVPAEVLLALRTINQALRHVAGNYFAVENPGSLQRCRQWSNSNLGAERTDHLERTFCELFPPLSVALGEQAPDEFLAASHDTSLLEMLLLFLNVTNPAAGPAVPLFDDSELRARSGFTAFVTGLESYLENSEVPGSEGRTIFRLLRAPALASPDSLSGQLAYIRDNWGHLLPPELLRRLTFAMDVLREVDLARSAEYGPPPVLEFGGDQSPAEPEPEAFSRDADWMSNVVLMAKSVYVWLDQLSRRSSRPINRLDQIPDSELDRLQGWGVTGLWLIGLWERSAASRRIKQEMGNAEAAASAYALHAYRIAADLGGEEAWRDLSERAGQRGIRLASDMVPNHMGLDSEWVVDHPEYFLQLDQPPYPAYRFDGPDLCANDRVSIRLEHGYWDHSDAAVVFQRVDNHTGDVRYIYHGNDGTSMPWNDTAQLNFLLPEVREAVTRVILDVARRFPIIRFDAAMTLAKKHYQRLWFPAPGDAGAIPSRAEHGLDKPAFDQVFPTEFWRDVVDRVAREVPDTLLLAEAFWLMEGYFVRTLGMHRVYNSAFMNMLKMEDNQKYRQTIKNVLEFSPAILQRFVNFMNNPDERTAVEQFGKDDKYLGCMLLLVTMPGLPMIGHGQIEGLSEKYGMEYRKAYWDEPVDEDLVARHEQKIFPLMRRRHLFSGADNFALFDFETEGGWVDENVYVYTNRSGAEKALIIFNNSFEQTRGRARLAAAVNTGSAEEPHLARRSLAEALAIEPAPGTWYIFSDRICGLEFLRSGAELAYEGFATHLNGYEARALVDFRQVRDTDGRWSRLAAELGGGGAPDLNLALRRLELKAELALVRQWIRPAVLAALEADQTDSPAAAADAEPVAAPDDLPTALRDVYARLQAWRAAALPPALGPQSKADLVAIKAAMNGSRIAQAIYVAQVYRLLPRPGVPAGQALPGLEAVAASDLALVRQEFESALVEWTGHDYAGRATEKLGFLLASGQANLVAMSRGRTAWLAEVLETAAAPEYFEFNTHEGKTYLRQEPLTDYLQSMVVTALAGLAGADSADAGRATESVATPATDPAGLLDSRALLAAAGVKAGFEVAALRTLLREGK